MVKKILMRFNYPLTDYVFQPGDSKYEDINHDGNIDSRDVVYLGNSNPKFTGGFGPNLAYKKSKYVFIVLFSLIDWVMMLSMVPICMLPICMDIAIKAQLYYRDGVILVM